MRLFATLALVALFAACGPAHLRSAGGGGERDLGELFLGGWDGRRLRVFNDTTIEPGTSLRTELLDALSHLSSDRYATVWIESAKLNPDDVTKHGLICGTPMCIVVFDRRGGTDLSQWGKVAALFELVGAQHQVVSSAWLADDAIRLPGPLRWPLRCLSEKDDPRYVHPEGGAVFPERKGPEGVGYALFDRSRVREGYRQRAVHAGFQAPSENTCDEDLARDGYAPPPPRPVIEADPKLLGKEKP